ncbi:MAG: ABC transporter permease [Coriobacteriia bacterium]|nr:ABC transporter permease [Coriobacteriia bacterium]
MPTTFIYTLRILVRDRSNLLWAMAFPLILMTLFYSMFNNLDEIYALEPIPVIVVWDSNYTDTRQGHFVEVVEALSSADYGEKPLLLPTYVPNEQAAIDELVRGDYYGYIRVDEEGIPHYFMDVRKAAGLDVVDNVKQSIVISILDRYLQNYEIIAAAVTEDPGLLADPKLLEGLAKEQAYVQQRPLVENPPSDSLRYYYAVLAFSCLQMISFGLSATNTWRAKSSPLGARRALGGQGWFRSLGPTLLAAWLISFVCVVLGFAYVRFGFGASFGGKEAACLVVLGVSSLATTSMGALLAALPIAENVKSGLVAVISTVFCIFAGLYGPASQKLGDYVAREYPHLSMLNPARQISEAFSSLYYYDTYDRLIEILTVLGVAAACFFTACVLIMRRQRYKSL